jgi:4-hydroxybenzoate polyprenyltransferase
MLAISIIKMMRPHQYVKNLFIFLPMFFAAQFTQQSLLFNAIIAFIAFSVTASGLY